MADDVILNKAASIERCVQRAREEYQKDPASFAQDHTRQDAAVLSIQRACEAALDLGHYLIRRDKLGLPQSARDVFGMLADAAYIDAGMAQSLKNMVGFCNIAVHDYQPLHLPIVVAVLTRELDEVRAFARKLLQR